MAWTSPVSGVTPDAAWARGAAKQDAMPSARALRRKFGRLFTMALRSFQLMGLD